MDAAKHGQVTSVRELLHEGGGPTAKGGCRVSRVTKRRGRQRRTEIVEGGCALHGRRLRQRHVIKSAGLHRSARTTGERGGRVRRTRSQRSRSTGTGTLREGLRIGARSDEGWR